MDNKTKESNKTVREDIAHSIYDFTKIPSGLTKFLWNCAGADIKILEKCTHADHVKYACLGGIVFATGFMAAMAGGYAFYTIFSQKGDNPHITATDVAMVFLSMIFGIIWGLMIFNLDRFIVSSTGKGDGKESISFSELINSLPRLLMGGIIALTISKPVEIRMFKSEIDTKLYEKKLELEKENNKKIGKLYDEKLQNLEKKREDIVNARKEIEIKVSSAQKALEDNLMGKANGVSAGDGPLSQALKTQIASLKEELEVFDVRNKDELAKINAEELEIKAKKKKDESDSKQNANGLDGLVERIKLAEEVAGSTISLFITLLFMSLELAPIFFKLMMVKTPYDYLDHNYKEIIKAKHGIFLTNRIAPKSNRGLFPRLRAFFFGHSSNETQEEVVTEVFALPESIVSDKLLLINAELSVKKHAIDKHIKEKMKQIDENGPGEIIQEEK